ncbi:hypothetical protein BH24GEM1_BH24GEM1_31840 [soil metagenome]
MGVQVVRSVALNRGLVGLQSLVVWAYLLGPVGALLALPLTIAIRRALQDADLAVPGLGREAPASAQMEGGAGP